VASDLRREQLLLRAGFLKEQGLDYVLDRPELHPPGKAGGAGKHPSKPGGDAPEPSAEMAAGRALLAQWETAKECRRCRLCEGRKQVVFGAGDPEARLMFIGEGPGADEDAQGVPFVGRAGQLLTDIITKGMGLERKSVYIANIVKCRPPDNRVPLPDEAAACLPYLKAQIAAIGPEVIVTLGKTAVLYLLGIETPITKVRGKWLSYEAIPVMPTFHPSYLLRNPAAKRDVWEDVQKVMAKLGIQRP
jgi:DNA polymerase